MPGKLRAGLALSLLGLCVLLAVAAQTLPFLEIAAAGQSYAVSGARLGDNLNLVLVATGALGAALATALALGRLRVRLGFLAVGGIGLGFSLLLWVQAHHTVTHGLIRDARIYERLGTAPVDIAVGSGLWASLFASVGILVLGGAVALLSRDRGKAPSGPRGESQRGLTGSRQRLQR